jgi:hypothetical protein
MWKYTVNNAKNGNKATESAENAKMKWTQEDKHLNFKN